MGSTPVIETDREVLLKVVRALGDPIRLEIVAQCAKVDECACTVLEELLPVSKSTISYHIKTLYHAGLIKVRREGRYYHYTLQRDVLEHFLPGMLDRLS